MTEKKNPPLLPQDLKHLRIITKKELSVLVPFTMQHVGRLEAAGLFPERIRVGENRVGWRLIEIEDWLNARPRGPVSAPPGPKNKNVGGAEATIRIKEDA